MVILVNQAVLASIAQLVEQRTVIIVTDILKLLVEICVDVVTFK